MQNNIFIVDIDAQKRVIETLYLKILDLFKKGIVVPKYRDGLFMSKLSNYYIINDYDVIEVMQNKDLKEVITFKYELDRPLSSSKIVLINSLSENILTDASYFLVKQQAEVQIERIMNNSSLSKEYKISVSVDIIDSIDDGEILWDIEFNLMASVRR